MEISETKIQGCYIINPSIFKDERGEFFESYNKAELERLLGQSFDFVQDNHSISNKGVLRGLHFQTGDYAQAKLVRVITGAVIDVVLDIRPDSPTYGEHLKIEISENNKKMLLIPRGMAHGFLAIEDHTVFVYKCDNYYNKNSEGGIYFNDPSLNIEWEYPIDEVLLSERDRSLPMFADISL